MKLLKSAAEINNELIRLIEVCSTCHVAVAWASVGFKAFKLLVNNSRKIERMVVGTHFFQTDPKFIESFLTHPTTRFVLQNNENQGSVFHPKVYLFNKNEGEWECLVGSPNFTSGGVCNNDEIAVLASHQDQGAEAFRIEIEATILRYWKKAVTLSPSDLEKYQITWAMKQPALKELQDPIQIEPILKCTWAQYFEMLSHNSKMVPQHYSIEGRLQVIHKVHEMFSANPHFEDMDLQKRYCIAGALYYKNGYVDGVHYLWFGSMWALGKFRGAVKANDPNLSRALDVIPLKGDVTKAAYLKYIEIYKKAFPHGRDGIPSATRLLAMKRPDVFVCLDGKNETKLYEAFGISKGINHKDYEKYWDSIIVPIMASPWWTSSPAPSGVEGEVWQARAAFLDCLYYEGIDSPNA